MTSHKQYHHIRICDAERLEDASFILYAKNKRVAHDMLLLSSDWSKEYLTIHIWHMFNSCPFVILQQGKSVYSSNFYSCVHACMVLPTQAKLVHMYNACTWVMLRSFRHSTILNPMGRSATGDTYISRPSCTRASLEFALVAKMILRPTSTLEEGSPM
jgi:hypothetical protein